MSNNKKYYWLKLKENFFEEDTITWLEEQDKGKEYSLFYLKLCLKSLKTNGLLIRNVGDILVPYDPKTLGKITNTDTDTVRVAMDILEKIGLVKILENGEIFLTQLENMVGSETKWAEKKRLQRQKKDNVPLLSDECPIRDKEIEIRDKEIEIRDKDTEIDIDKEKLSVSCFLYFQKSGIMLTPNQSQEVISFIDDGMEEETIIKAIDEAVGSGKRNYKYIKGILNNWITNNIKTVNDVENNKREFEESKLSKKAREGNDGEFRECARQLDTTTTTQISKEDAERFAEELGIEL